MPKEETYRFADSTVIAPLVNYWPAWSYVLSPVAASLHLLHYQIQTMRSYMQNPSAHFRASRDPSLIGGPFMNIPVERADEVGRLLAETERKQQGNLEFAAAITEFCGWLSTEAKGQSLESFYQALPQRLRGCVELVYDYNNNPLVRFIEGLLYESVYYDESLQSLRLGQHARDDSRPFFMSTPSLLSEGQIEWATPFAAPQVDELYELDVRPQPLGHIRELLGLNGGDEETLLPLLTNEPHTPPAKWDGQTVRLRYFGHACVLVEHRGISILTDPLIAVRPTEAGAERFTFRDLPARIDYALVTHNHCDHFVLETLLRLRHRIDCLVVPRTYGVLYGDVSLKLLARKLGFKNVLELDTFEAIALPDGEITAVPFLGEHGDLAHGKTAYVVRAGHERILFGADSNCLDAQVYEKVRGHVGPIPTVFLGIEPVGAPLSWSYGPLFPKTQRRDIDKTRRQRGCDLRGALAILEAVGATRIYNYGMGQEPWLEHILALTLSEDSSQISESNRLLAEARRRGFTAAERLLGKCEIHLDNSPAKPQVFASATALDEGSGAEAQTVRAEGVRRPNADDAEDQFAF
jgi:L-ascorbate metabolism protein UlaG (beta-lactamase superfamily)